MFCARQRSRVSEVDFFDRFDSCTYTQLFRAHQSVKRKKAAMTRDATFAAFVSNPQTMSAAPMSDEPRYPAGRVTQGIPPDIRVAPPSSAVQGTPWSTFQSEG